MPTMISFCRIQACVLVQTRLRLLFVCVRISARKKRLEGGASTRSQHLSPAAACGALVFFCICLDFPQNIYHEYILLRNQRQISGFIIFFFLRGPEKRTRVVSPTSASTKDQLLTCNLVVLAQDTQGEAVGNAA